jgi:hypothetical protein
MGAEIQLKFARENKPTTSLILRLKPQKSYRHIVIVPQTHSKKCIPWNP